MAERKNEVTSDQCKFTKGRILMARGIAGYSIETAGSNYYLRTAELRGIIYSPTKQTLTFCAKGIEGQPKNYTFYIPLTKIDTLHSRFEPLFAQIGDFLKQSQNPDLLT